MDFLRIFTPLAIQLMKTCGDKKGWLIGTVVGVGGGFFLYAFLQHKYKKDEIITANDSENKTKLKTIKAQTKADIELEDKKTENKIKVINAQMQAKLELAKAKAEAKQREKDSNQGGCQFPPTDQPSANNVALPPTYNEVLNATKAEGAPNIFTRHFHWYDTCGIVGSSNSGKSTLVRQIARSMSLGHQEVELFPDWVDGRTVAVLLIALEHNGLHIKAYDAGQNTFLPNLRIDMEVTSLDYLTNTIKATADAYPEGLVVIIDNYTKLEQLADEKIKPMTVFTNWMEKLKIDRQKEGKPIANIYVFHTKDDYREHRPLTLHHVCGSANYTRFCQDFLALEPCGRGGNYRLLKSLKNKYESTIETVSVLRYADTDVNMYEYVEEGNEVDELPQPFKPKKDKDANPAQQQAVPETKVGRPSELSDEEAFMFWDMVSNGEATWKEIEEVYGHSSGKIKKRCKDRGYRPSQKKEKRA